MSVFTDKAKKYIPMLQKDLDITLEQACGIFGNIGAETGGFKYLQEINPVVQGSRGGYGWMQWTGPRRVKYEAWCKSKGLNPATDSANYLYLVHETKTDEANSLRLLKLTTTVKAATETFMAKNLRPGVPHLNSRINWANIAYETTKNGTTTKPSVNLPKTPGEVGFIATASALAVAMASWFTDHWHYILGGSIIGIAMVVIVANLIRKKTNV